MEEVVPAEMITLAENELESNEMIKSWGFLPKNRAIARLIDKDLFEVAAESLRKFGMGGGAGRTLEFKKKNGTWTLTGTGGWIS